MNIDVCSYMRKAINVVVYLNFFLSTRFSLRSLVFKMFSSSLFGQFNSHYKKKRQLSCWSFLLSISAREDDIRGLSNKEKLNK